MLEAEHFYFGRACQPLFGCHHAPQGVPARQCGVVLCYPLGREYIRSHRTYRQLAIRLCNIGFHVLRFDFYGCGDSHGDDEQGDIEQWLDDISTAAAELRKRSGLTRVSLAGLRFGGTLAMLAGAKQKDIESLVLWNPIVSGRSYIDELTTMHQQTVVPPRTETEDNNHERYVEISGFPFSISMLTHLEKLDLLGIPEVPATNLLLLESTAKPTAGRLKAHLESVVSRLDYLHIPGPKIWTDDAKALVPSQVIQSMVSWMSEVSS